MSEREVIPCDPEFADTAAFCEKYGYTLEQSANTILVVGKSEPKSFCACVVTADRRLDVNGTVRRLLGTRKASFASADDTIAVTGMMIGGVTPFGLPVTLPIYIDTVVMEQPWVIVGGGDRSSKLKLPPSELAALPSAEVVEGLSLSPA
ncbi:MAG TPA: YbaK/EbsC family protein [Acidimicrobiales bacterium]|nr:YbaK/EbsC family protein [Acidimicrobiales bacterium]